MYLRKKCKSEWKIENDEVKWKQKDSERKEKKRWRKKNKTKVRVINLERGGQRK